MSTKVEKKGGFRMDAGAIVFLFFGLMIAVLMALVATVGDDSGYFG
jgi:hypothetical protein